MDTIGANRKRQFQAALALAGENMKGWARDHGVSYSHLRQVLLGRQAGAALDAAIDAFIDAHLAQHTPAA